MPESLSEQQTNDSVAHLLLRIDVLLHSNRQLKSQFARALDSVQAEQSVRYVLQEELETAQADLMGANEEIGFLKICVSNAESQIARVLTVNTTLTASLGLAEEVHKEELVYQAQQPRTRRKNLTTNSTSTAGLSLTEEVHKGELEKQTLRPRTGRKHHKHKPNSSNLPLEEPLPASRHVGTQTTPASYADKASEVALTMEGMVEFISPVPQTDTFDGFAIIRNRWADLP